MVAEKGVSWKNPPCLPERLKNDLGLLLGGWSGNSFLVEPDGLTWLGKGSSNRIL